MININKRKISINHKPYIIAELSSNHNGNINNALKAIKIAKTMGADAIKLQTYTPDTLTINSQYKDFKINKGAWKGNTLYNLYKKAHTPFEWHKELFSYAKNKRITCFSSVFDESSVDLLEKLNTPAYKISSFEIIDINLLKYVAKTKKPIILSTGMANLNEIDEAIDVVKSNGCKKLALLHCVSSYPTPYNEYNMSCIRDLIKRYNLVVGLSDHSLGITLSITAVSLGASIIEKHFTIDKKIKSPDSFFSIDPNELRLLVESTSKAWESIGSPNYEIKKSEKDSIKYRRSIYVIKNIKKGEIFNQTNIRVIRPGYGILPKYFNDIIGKKSIKKIKKHMPLKWHQIDQ